MEIKIYFTDSEFFTIQNVIKIKYNHNEYQIKTYQHLTDIYNESESSVWYYFNVEIVYKIEIVNKKCKANIQGMFYDDSDLDNFN